MPNSWLFLLPPFKPRACVFLKLTFCKGLDKKISFVNITDRYAPVLQMLHFYLFQQVQGEFSSGVHKPIHLK